MDDGSRNRELESHLDLAVRQVRARHLPTDALRRALERARHPDQSMGCWLRWLLDGGAATN